MPFIDLTNIFGETASVEISAIAGIQELRGEKMQIASVESVLQCDFRNAGVQYMPLGAFYAENNKAVIQARVHYHPAVYVNGLPPGPHLAQETRQEILERLEASPERQSEEPLI